MKRLRCGAESQDEHQWKCEVIDKKNFLKHFVSPTSLQLYQNISRNRIGCPITECSKTNETPSYDVNAFGP